MQKIRKVNDWQGLVGHENYRTEQDSDITYVEAVGWHFYSMLKVRMGLQKGESAQEEARLIRMYKNYTLAAVKAASRSKKECKILEHQGNVIHFFFPTTQKNEVSIIKVFASELSLLVDEYVMGYYDNDVLQFHMGAEFGRSIIIHSISPELGDWSDSTVSIGPSANNPAKKMGDSTDESSRPLWWRDHSEGGWNLYDAQVKSEERVKTIQEYQTVMAEDAFESVVPTYSRIGVQSQLIDPNAANQIIRRQGFFFRADMDGFTRRVERAFESSGEIERLVQDFVAYMEIAHRWEVASEMCVVVHPWAGDCYNSLIVAKDSNLWMGMSLAMKTYPRNIIRSWASYVKKITDKDVKWVYALSGGDVVTFGVKTSERTFKLSVGGPAGKTLASVNFEENKGGYLVMPATEAVATGMAFKSYDFGRHPNFKYNETADRQADRVESIAEARSKAAVSVVGGRTLAATRPWGV